MPLPPVRQKLLTDAVAARAATLDTTDQPTSVFVAEVDKPLPTLPNSDRVGRYLVIYPLGRTPGPDPDQADTSGDAAYGFQVNCAAGFRADAEYLVDQVFSLFHRWVPPVPDLVVGPFRPPVGYQPGPLRRNDTVKPPRFWLPLQFTTTADPATT